MTEKKFEDHVKAFDQDYPDTDMFAYFGPIRRPYDDEVIEIFEERGALRKNLIFALSTLGGDPDAAYRIARCIQGKYGLLLREPKKESRGKVSIYVDTVCASAGTLIALCADELIMSEFAELSPLDIQVRKPDDVWERDSGLTPTQALDLLERRSKSLFKEHFNQLRLDSEMGLTTKTAVATPARILNRSSPLVPVRDRRATIIMMVGIGAADLNCWRPMPSPLASNINTSTSARRSTMY